VYLVKATTFKPQLGLHNVRETRASYLHN